MNYLKKLNQIKVLLGMEVKMAEAVLEDGVTKIVAESFEPGYEVKVISESGEEAPAPEGTHTLQDGTKITLDANGKITLVEKPEPKIEVEVEAAADEVPAGEKPAGEPTKSENEIVKEEMKKMIMQCMEAIEEVAKEVGTIKEEMAAYKSKMEKMSATPASNKISTYNTESTEPANPIESRLEALKAVRAEFNKGKRKF